MQQQECCSAINCVWNKNVATEGFPALPGLLVNRALFFSFSVIGGCVSEEGPGTCPSAAVASSDNYRSTDYIAVHGGSPRLAICCKYSFHLFLMKIYFHSLSINKYNNAVSLLGSIFYYYSIKFSHGNRETI